MTVALFDTLQAAQQYALAIIDYDTDVVIEHTSRGFEVNIY